jgi:hypothetical protein
VYVPKIFFHCALMGAGKVFFADATAPAPETTAAEVAAAGAGAGEAATG